MKFDGIIEKIVQMAKENKKTIALPESEDPRVLKAASIVAQENIASVVLIGDPNKIQKAYENMQIDISQFDMRIENPLDSMKKEAYIEAFYELRKHKGMTREQAEQMMSDMVYFAVMMLQQGDVDGVVSGAVHSSSDTLRPALQIIKQAPGVNTVSSFFLMDTPKKALGSNGVFIFSDCGLVRVPSEEELCDITISSAKTFRLLVGEEPRAALLSYSTKGSGAAKSDEIGKIIRVVANLQERNLDFAVDGELQLDAAIIPEVAQMKAPDSKVAGHANILIFPDLQSGNIAYKLVQRFGDAVALGPITQGLRKPVNDLSRGCNVEDIIGAVAITCVQAQHS